MAQKWYIRHESNSVLEGQERIHYYGPFDDKKATDEALESAYGEQLRQAGNLTPTKVSDERVEQLKEKGNLHEKFENPEGVSANE